MFKKSLATALLVCSIPAMANAAWFLATQVTSAGGTLTSSNKAGQVVTDGMITKSYSAIAAQTPTATPDGNSTLRSLTVKDTDTAGVTSILPGTSFTPVDGHTYTVAASFKADFLSVKATNIGGSVTPSSLGNIYKGYKLTAPLTFTFSPKGGYTITAINNIPAGATSVIPATVNAKATVTFPKDYVFSADLDLQAVVANTTPGLNAILPQTIAVGQTATLTPSVNNIANPVYAWTYVSGPANTETVSKDQNGKVTVSVTPGPAVILAPDAAVPGQVSFTAGQKGQYKFRVAVGAETTMATVNVLATAADASNQCQYCHTANNISSVADTSSHTGCQSCHFGGAGHPGSVNASTVNAATFAVTAENVSNGNGTTVASGANFCVSCHGVTGNPAQAAPALTTHQDKACSDCHSSAHQTHVASTACQSCHAAVHSEAAMGTSGCLDCHDGHRPTFGTRPLVGSVSHPAVTLYTFEEVGYQMNGGQPVPVQVDANGKGMPYSPKMTCGTSGCHVKNGVNYTYDKISDHAFHSAQGRNEFQDTADGKLDARKNKPWGQSSAMVGKW